MAFEYGRTSGHICDPEGALLVHLEETRAVAGARSPTRQQRARFAHKLATAAEFASASWDDCFRLLSRPSRNDRSGDE